jgi:hypothetical protein
MFDRSTLERERDTYAREIATLETQIKSLRDYISTQERNLRTAADSVRDITERGLAEARSDLNVKDLRLQQVRQDMQNVQRVLGKISDVERKQRDIQTLEREQGRVAEMLDRARIDLARLMDEAQNLTGASSTTATPTRIIHEYALDFGGERVALPPGKPELLVGCADPSTFPDVDLTPFGGTNSGVSRRHANLRFNNGAWSIVDLNSTNGTFVDATRIAPNTPTPLREGARLRFGGVDATFVKG